MKIKIIDLLNMIAKGEDVPKTIYYQKKYYNLIKEYNDDWEEYEFGYMADGGGYLNIWRFDVLNDEVVIIEDKPKEIKKISLDIDKFEDSYYDTALIKIAGVVDELIDKVNEMSKND